MAYLVRVYIVPVKPQTWRVQGRSRGEHIHIDFTEMSPMSVFGDATDFRRPRTRQNPAPERCSLRTIPAVLNLATLPASSDCIGIPKQLVYTHAKVYMWSQLSFQLFCALIPLPIFPFEPCLLPFSIDLLTLFLRLRLTHLIPYR